MFCFSLYSCLVIYLSLLHVLCNSPYIFFIPATLCSYVHLSSLLSRSEVINGRVALCCLPGSSDKVCWLGGKRKLYGKRVALAMLPAGRGDKVRCFEGIRECVKEWCNVTCPEVVTRYV